MKAEEWTTGQIAGFQAELDKAMQRKFRLKPLTPLPLRSRMRLVWQNLVNQAGSWLVDRKMTRAARTLWRI